MVPTRPGPDCDVYLRGLELKIHTKVVRSHLSTCHWCTIIASGDERRIARAFDAAASVMGRPAGLRRPKTNREATMARIVDEFIAG